MNAEEAMMKCVAERLSGDAEELRAHMGPGWLDRQAETHDCLGTLQSWALDGGDAGGIVILLLFEEGIAKYIVHRQAKPPHDYRVFEDGVLFLTPVATGPSVPVPGQTSWPNDPFAHMPMRVVVPCRDSNGMPVLFGALVHCSRRDYDEGDHYEVAEQLAKAAGYSLVAHGYGIDQDDGLPWLLAHWDWHTQPLPTLRVPGAPPAPPPTAHIVVEGGVVQDVDVPPGIRVVVRDYDVEGVEGAEDLPQDEDGAHYTESTYEGD
jgi:hypothetical protein